MSKETQAQLERIIRALRECDRDMLHFSLCPEDTRVLWREMDRLYAMESDKTGHIMAGDDDE